MSRLIVIFSYILIISTNIEATQNKENFWKYALGMEKGLMLFIASNESIYCSIGDNIQGDKFFSEKNKFDKESLKLFLKENLKKDSTEIYLGADEDVSYKKILLFYYDLMDLYKELDIEVEYKVSLLSYSYKSDER